MARTASGRLVSNGPSDRVGRSIVVVHDYGLVVHVMLIVEGRISLSVMMVVNVLAGGIVSGRRGTAAGQARQAATKSGC